MTTRFIRMTFRFLASLPGGRETKPLKDYSESMALNLGSEYPNPDSSTKLLIAWRLECPVPIFRLCACFAQGCLDVCLSTDGSLSYSFVCEKLFLNSREKRRVFGAGFRGRGRPRHTDTFTFRFFAGGIAGHPIPTWLAFVLGCERRRRNTRPRLCLSIAANRRWLRR